MNELVCVQTYRFRPEAELAQSVLEANGIESVLTADDAHGMRPMVGLSTGGVRLCVLSEDAEKAVAILDRADQSI